MPQLQAAAALRRLGLSLGSDDGLRDLRSVYGDFTEGFGLPDLVEAAELLTAR